MTNIHDAIKTDRTLRWVIIIVGIGLLSRFLFLGSRVSHFDEARVAWWGLDYARTGTVEYRFIIHGPFLQHVHRPLFTVFEPTDFVSRIPIALFGGLLPFVSLWFRRHLREIEVIGLAFFLALNPIILYYSRFMRSVVLVAGFSFIAFAAFVRWYDGLGQRYLYIGAGFLALAFTAKENAIVYILCWLGAAALLLDTALFRPRNYDSGHDLVSTHIARLKETLEFDSNAFKKHVVAQVGHFAGATLIFLFVIFFFFAPRGGEAGLWAGNLALTLNQTIADITDGFDYWFGQSGTVTLETYLDRFGLFLESTLTYAGPLFALAILGFLVERYGRGDSRKIVLGCSYWGFASIVGYPLGMDIWAPWTIINALVPLAVPAAVGLGFIIDLGRKAIADADYLSATTVAVVLILIGGQIAFVGSTAVFVSPTDHESGIVQFAQPQQEMQVAIDSATATAEQYSGDPDVLFYGGEDFTTMDETAVRTPACIDWFRTLPWAWYLDATDASVTCAQTPDQLPETLPPVIVVEAECTQERVVDCREDPDALEPHDEFDEQVPDSYDRYGVLHRTTGGNYFDGMVIYIDSD